MINRRYPTITQANIMFFLTAVLTLAGSAFFQPRLGLGTNLWINEFVYILFPPLLLAGISRWSVEDVYRLKLTSMKNNIISILAGVSLWFFASYISRITGILLDNRIGVVTNPEQTSPSVYQSLLLVIGVMVLAPICEEIFFRGFVQRAYEGYSKRYGFVITGILFGSYHVLNGISEVISTTILGIGMGYLVYKTGSITSSILFHAAANTSAVVLGGAIAISTPAAIPVWLHIIALVGLCSSLVLLRSIKGECQSNECEDEVQKENRASATGIVFLVLSAVFLITAGIVEILTRLAILKV